MSRPTAEVVPPKSIPEVAAFLKVQRELAKLREHFPTAYAKLLALADVYNPTLEAADKAVRTRAVTCGPFEVKDFARKLDVEQLVDLLGRGEFVRHGGVIATAETFALDLARFEGLVARGVVTEEIERRVLKHIPRYSKPGSIVLP